MRILRYVAKPAFADMLLAMTWSLVRLATYCRLLRKADVIVIMAQQLGFGHTITGPDVARRIFPGRRCVFVILSRNPYHNPMVASIWPDIDVIFLKASLLFGGPSRGLPSGISQPLVYWLVRRLGGPRPIVISPRELYERIPLPEGMPSSTLDNLELNYRWPIAYFNLQNEVLAPRVSLPLNARNKVRNRLNRALSPTENGSAMRLCALYLRQKGSVSDDITSNTRDGSLLEEYLPAIRLLNQAHYRVLVIGDVVLSPSLYAAANGMLADAQSLRTNKQLFGLFAATEADIFIGEAGGGNWLPGINGIPRLILNGFPFFLGFPNTSIYFKTVTDSSGRLMDYRTLFADHGYDYELQGMTLHNNSAEEITKAVTCFLKDLSQPDALDPNAGVIEQLPDDMWSKYWNAKISPAWLNLYDEVRDQVGR